jgi:uncharacterized protein YgbK (DUF1537 family)
MEVLTFAGLPAMLFLEPPTQDQLAKYSNLKGIGVASTARAQSPQWMDAELPGIFAQLAALKPALTHYKVCSTLDSSTMVGSIGHAIEIGARTFSPAAVPVLIAAPQMRRFQSFGHLFASFGDAVFRLDQHPVMSRHPITPMNESDVAKHITLQSDKIETRCLTLEDLSAGAQLPRKAVNSDRIDVITLDCIDAETELAVGRLLWDGRSANPFVIGSQGVEYALVRHLQDTGQIATVAAPQGIGPADQMVVVSGSVSPTTADQIAWAKANGFMGIPFDATCVCQDEATQEKEVTRTVATCLEAIDQGRDPLVYTAEGPDDPAIEAFKAAAKKQITAANQKTGEALGQILHQTLTQSGVRRAVVSGGDTSGYATRKLGIYALTALAPTIPGAALFQAHAEGAMDGLQLALKGGQMGSQDYFGWIRNGGGPQ